MLVTLQYPALNFFSDADKNSWRSQLTATWSAKLDELNCPHPTPPPHPRSLNPFHLYIRVEIILKLLMLTFNLWPWFVVLCQRMFFALCRPPANSLSSAWHRLIACLLIYLRGPWCLETVRILLSVYCICFLSVLC